MSKNYLFTILILSLLGITQQAYSQKTILWKVTDPTNSKTSYIVGTFHQMGNSFVDAIPEIKEALLNSEVAVFESIEQVEDARKAIESRPRSNKIEKHIKQKDLLRLKEITKDWKVDLYKLKPLEIRWKLAQEYQYVVCETVKPTDEFDQFDGYLQHLAETNNIELLGLETNQLAILEKANDAPDWKQERGNIRFWINKITSDSASSENCVLADRYRNFEIGYEFEKDCESDYLVQERNNLWMEQIPELLRTKDAFVAVGYYHLRWKCGLLEQLKDLGFSVEPVILD